uniref:DDHD domain-containing protein n=1 Tax=Knipowitschia caucasica TaxID=637954 RepID=A0AAV2JL02_KNICA
MSAFNIPSGSATVDLSGANNNNQDWAYPYPCGNMSPMEETLQAGMSSVQAGLDVGHLRGLGASQEHLLLDLGSPPGFLQGGSQAEESSDSEGNFAAQYEGRRKRSRSNSSRHRFHDVVTELGPEEVRWFYKEDKKTWKPFLGHDSLKIELVFRKYCELNPRTTESQVNNADDEFPGNGVESRGLNGTSPADSKSSAAQSPQNSIDASTLSPSHRDLDGMVVPLEPVCVRGGLYEVDIILRECYPVYWKQQDHIPVMRGQWFIDGSWLPLDEDESDLIEQEHLRRFRGQQMQDTLETDQVVSTVDRKDGEITTSCV